MPDPDISPLPDADTPDPKVGVLPEPDVVVCTGVTMVVKGGATSSWHSLISTSNTSKAKSSNTLHVLVTLSQQNILGKFISMAGFHINLLAYNMHSKAIALPVSVAASVKATKE